jgi:hypothetical protein
MLITDGLNEIRQWKLVILAVVCGRLISANGIGVKNGSSKTRDITANSSPKTLHNSVLNFCLLLS